jgi:hypothetical protein
LKRYAPVTPVWAKKTEALANNVKNYGKKKTWKSPALEEKEAKDRGSVGPGWGYFWAHKAKKEGVGFVYVHHARHRSVVDLIPFGLTYQWTVPNYMRPSLETQSGLSNQRVLRGGLTSRRALVGWPEIRTSSDWSFQVYVVLRLTPPPQHSALLSRGTSLDAPEEFRDTNSVLTRSRFGSRNPSAVQERDAQKHTRAGGERPRDRASLAMVSSAEVLSKRSKGHAIADNELHNSTCAEREKTSYHHSWCPAKDVLWRIAAASTRVSQS